MGGKRVQVHFDPSTLEPIGLGPMGEPGIISSSGIMCHCKATDKLLWHYQLKWRRKINIFKEFNLDVLCNSVLSVVSYVLFG